MQRSLVVLMALFYLQTSYATHWKGQWASSFGKIGLGAFKFSHNETGSNFKGAWRFSDIDKELKWNGTKAAIQDEVDYKGIDRYRNIGKQMHG